MDLIRLECSWYFMLWVYMSLFHTMISCVVISYYDFLSLFHTIIFCHYFMLWFYVIISFYDFICHYFILWFYMSIPACLLVCNYSMQCVMHCMCLCISPLISAVKWKFTLIMDTDTADFLFIKYDCQSNSMLVSK